MDNHGHWGIPTGTIDWCEYNYTHSYYIAEFYNTLSNLAYVMCGIHGIYETILVKGETRYYWGFAALIGIGVGSAMFHATLQFSAQLWDEVPMLWASLTWLYGALEYRPKRRWKYLPFIIFSGGFLFTLFYSQYPNPLFFEISWGSLTITAVFLSYPQLTEPYAKKVFFSGFGIFLLGFGSWLLDQHFCDHVRPFKLHAVWHILTCYGAMLLSFAGFYTRLKVVMKRQITLKFVGPFPHFVEKEKFAY